ncbi:MAG: flippase-like domain-containing protein [Firmicutes bacterium]|nr:flippase-like domain-containing protein [Bacillota bacterium]
MRTNNNEEKIAAPLPAWRKGLYFSLMLSIASALVIFFLNLDDDTLHSLYRVRPQYLVLALLVLFLLGVIEGLRIREISKDVSGKAISFARAAQVYLFTFFFAQVTPLALGEWPAHIYALNRHGLTLGQSSAATVIRSFFTKLIFALFAGFFMIFTRGRLTDSFLNHIFRYAFIITILNVCFFLLLLARPNLLEMFAQKISHLSFLKKYLWQTKQGDRLFLYIQRELHRFKNATRSISRYHSASIFYIFLLTVAYWLCYFSIAPVLLLGLNVEFPFWTALIWQLMVFMVIAYLPIPGGSGVTEFGLATLFNVFVPSSVLGIFILAWRFYTYYLLLFWGGITALGQLAQQGK